MLSITILVLVNRESLKIDRPAAITAVFSQSEGRIDAG